MIHKISMQVTVDGDVFGIKDWKSVLEGVVNV